MKTTNQNSQFYYLPQQQNLAFNQNQHQVQNPRPPVKQMAYQPYQHNQNNMNANKSMQFNKESESSNKSFSTVSQNQPSNEKVIEEMNKDLFKLKEQLKNMINKEDNIRQLQHIPTPNKRQASNITHEPQRNLSAENIKPRVKISNDQFNFGPIIPFNRDSSPTHLKNVQAKLTFNNKNQIAYEQRSEHNKFHVFDANSHQLKHHSELDHLKFNMQTKNNPLNHSERVNNNSSHQFVKDNENQEENNVNFQKVKPYEISKELLSNESKLNQILSQKRQDKIKEDRFNKTIKDLEEEIITLKSQVQKQKQNQYKIKMEHEEKIKDMKQNYSLQKEFEMQEQKYLEIINKLQTEIRVFKQKQSHLHKKTFEEALKTQIEDNTKFKHLIEDRNEEIAKLKENIAEQNKKLMEHANEMKIKEMQYSAVLSQQEKKFQISILDKKNEIQSLKRASETLESKYKVAIREVDEKDKFIANYLIGRVKEVSEQDSIKNILSKYEIAFPTNNIMESLLAENIQIQSLKAKLHHQNQKSFQ